jgi:hypothetical protein
LKLVYNRKIQLARGLKGVIPSPGTRGSAVESPPQPPQLGSFQNGAKFHGKTPLTKVEHEFLLYDDIE